MGQIGDNIWWNKDRLIQGDPRNLSTSRFSERHPYIWEKVVFTVPDTVSDERVHENDGYYRNQGGRIMEERYKYTVLAVDGPHEDRGLVARQTTDPDRRRYVVWYKVTKRPEPFTIDVDDRFVPAYLNAGLHLN
jgi:hypothetical protein